MVRSVLTAMFVLLVVTTPARADAQAAAEEKSPSVAVSLSVGVTAAGLITFVSGGGSVQMLGLGLMFIGPSTGRWYAGEDGLGGLGLRTLAAAGMVGGLVQVLRSDCDTEEECGNGGAGGAMILGGAALWIGSSIAHVVFAERAARRWNENHALALTPTIGNTTGLALTGRF